MMHLAPTDARCRDIVSGPVRRQGLMRRINRDVTPTKYAGYTQCIGSDQTALSLKHCLRRVAVRFRGRARGSWVGLLMTIAALGPLCGTAMAQITPAAGYTPPDDTPSIRIGMTLFPAFIYQTDPKITDAAGNQVSKSSFDVLRS